MIRRPPRATRTDTLVPDTTLCRSPAAPAPPPEKFARFRPRGAPRSRQAQNRPEQAAPPFPPGGRKVHVQPRHADCPPPSATLPDRRCDRRGVPPPPVPKRAWLRPCAGPARPAGERRAIHLPAVSPHYAPHRPPSPPLPPFRPAPPRPAARRLWRSTGFPAPAVRPRSEEHTSELQSLMRISYAVFCLTKK